MITKWIFPDSNWKGLLKNIQDGISRPLKAEKFTKQTISKGILSKLFRFENFWLWQLASLMMPDLQI